MRKVHQSNKPDELKNLFNPVGNFIQSIVIPVRQVRTDIIPSQNLWRIASLLNNATVRKATVLVSPIKVFMQKTYIATIDISNLSLLLLY
jgi:hypothetical protein